MLEVVDDMKDTPIDSVVVPFGGGGLIAGISMVSKGLTKNTKVIGAEPEKKADGKRSLEAKDHLPNSKPDTICDGLRVSLGKLTFDIIKDNVDEVLLASDKECVEAMYMIWNRLKIICEPACAIPLAVVLKNPE